MHTVTGVDAANASRLFVVVSKQHEAKLGRVALDYQKKYLDVERGDKVLARRYFNIALVLTILRQHGQGCQSWLARQMRIVPKPTWLQIDKDDKEALDAVMDEVYDLVEQTRTKKRNT